MHSPKFPGKATHLRKIVAAQRLQRLWKKTVRDHMRRQIVPDPVEFLDFHINIKQRCNELENSISSGEYQPKRIIRLKSEKSRGLCRQLVLPTPEDALVLQALSNALWDEVKKKAPATNSFYAPKDQPFAKKNSFSDGQEWGYGPIEAWLDFQTTVLSFSKEYKYVVVTDIANYYDCILHGFLRAILAEYAQEKEHALDLLLYILDSMLWRPDYMPNYGIGLPQMDQDAPRLLAHTHLFEVDEIFSKDAKIDFARYMDDMDFGVDGIAKAKSVLRDLDLVLQTRNLRLNSGKTKILTADEAIIHFRAEDNLLVNKLNEKIRNKAYLDKFNKIYARLVGKAISVGLKRNRFENGNGDKILKRLMSTALSVNAEIDAESFRKILYGKPGLRQLLIVHWSQSSNPGNKLSILSGYLRSGEAVDDLSKVQIATGLVNARHQHRMKNAEWKLFFESYSRSNPFELFSRLWLLSRFASPAELKAEIDATNLMWSQHPFLARTVAGFYGTFRGTPLLPAFEGFVRKWGGSEANALVDFHESLSGSVTVFNAVNVFIKAGNKSSINGLTHAKTLMLENMLSSLSISKLEKAKCLGTCAAMMNDIYYFARFCSIISALP